MIGALVAGLTQAAFAADQLCRVNYVIPYAEQCKFEHDSIKKDGSLRNVENAFASCNRAQDVANDCLSSKDRQIHAIAVSAMYRSVSQQADIAMFASQYSVAETLLREKLSLLETAAKEARPGERGIPVERAAIARDLASAHAGECTEAASAAAGSEHGLAHARKFDELGTLLETKFLNYTKCAQMEPSPGQRAYIQYAALVALEESGRADQAAGKHDEANSAYRACLDGVAHALPDAAGQTKRYLGALTLVCQGRMSGKFGVDQPQPLGSLDAPPQSRNVPK